VPNWNADEIQARELDRARRGQLTQPFGVYNQSVSSDNETGNWSYSGNQSRTMSVVHPFSSSGSWIRAMPEPGAAFVATFRADEARPQLLNSFTRGAVNRVNSYKDGAGLYRPLQPGEIETSSAGYAKTYWTRRSQLVSNAGILQRWADQDRLMCGDRAPIHQKQLFQYADGQMGDEYRLGLVSRPKTSWQASYPKYNGFYAAEEYLSIKNPSLVFPQELVHVQRGHVLDETGEAITQTSTGLPLRKQSLYYALDDSPTVHEVDEQGNVYFETADMAVQGYEINIPSGNYKRTVQLDEFISCTGMRQDSVGAEILDIDQIADWKVGTSLTIKNKSTSHEWVADETGVTSFTTGSGHTIILDDVSNSVTLETAAGSQMVLDDAGGTVTIASFKKSSAVLESNGGITLTAAGGDTTVTMSPFNGIRIKEAGGGELNLANGLVALGNSSAELVNIVNQIAQALATCTAPGFGAPLSIAPQMPPIISLITQIMGTIS